MRIEIGGKLYADVKYFKVFTCITGVKKARIAFYKPINSGSDIKEVTLGDGSIFVHEDDD